MTFYLHDGKFLLDDGKFAISEDCCCGDEPSGCYKLIPCATNDCGSCDPELYDQYEVTFAGMYNSSNDGTYVFTKSSMGCYWEATPDDYFTLIWDGVSDYWIETYDTQYTDFLLDVDECDGPVGTYTVNTGQGTCSVAPLGTNTTVSGEIITDTDLSATSGVIRYDEECYTVIDTECSGAISLSGYTDFENCEDCAGLVTTCNNWCGTGAGPYVDIPEVFNITFTGLIGDFSGCNNTVRMTYTPNWEPYWGVCQWHGTTCGKDVVFTPYGSASWYVYITEDGTSSGTLFSCGVEWLAPDLSDDWGTTTCLDPRGSVPPYNCNDSGCTDTDLCDTQNPTCTISF